MLALHMDGQFPLRNMFSNPGLKLLGLFLAMLLWFHVATDKEYEIDIPYTFEYSDPPESLVIAAKPPALVNVRARATGKALIRTLWQDRIWHVRLDSAQVGTLTVAISPDDVPKYGIEGLDIIQMSRDTIRIVIDSISQKRVPIVSAAVWELAPNYVRTGQETWTPDSVLITGPKQTLRRISSVRSAALEIRNQSESVDREVELAPPDAFAVTISPTVARMQQVIEPFVKQEFTNLDINVTSRSQRSSPRVDPSTISVEIGGPQSVLHRLPIDSIIVACVVSPRDTTGQKRPVYVNVPPPLQVLSKRPDSVTVQWNDRSRTDTGS